MDQHIRELRNQHSTISTQAQALLAGEFNPETEQQFDRMMAEADALEVRIRRHERAAHHAALASQDPPADPTGLIAARERAERSDERRDAYNLAFGRYLRFGIEELTGEERKLLRGGYQGAPEARAQTSTTTGGGYLIPTGYSNELDKALLAFGGMRRRARVIRTATGNSLPWPTVNDTSNKAVITSENTQTSSPTDVTFGQTSLGAFTYRSLILAPIELLQDSFFNLDAEFPMMLGERVARGTEEHFATGNGSTQPNGAVTASTAGKTAASSSTVTYDELLDLQHSVDPAYRRSPSCAWMFNDTTLKIIRKIKDSNNMPIWQGVPFSGGPPAEILGHPYEINQSIASIEASAKSILFGDFSKYIIRDVAEYLLLRLTERYADYGQVGFIVFSRHDGELIDAGTHPIKHLVHPSP